jgi:hypothetical protein
MKSKRLVAASSIVALCMAAAVAFAGAKGVSLKDLRCLIKSNTITIKGTLKDVDPKKKTTVTAHVVAKAIVDCKNPAGKFPPGQQGKKVILDVKESVKVEAIKGVATFKLILKFFVSAADICPNPQWTAIVRKLRIKSCRIIVEEDGKRVLTEDCAEECAGDDDDDDHCPDDGKKH